MSSTSNESNAYNFWIDTDQALYYYIQFWIFLVLSLMNIPCSIATLYHHIVDQNGRHALHNYTTLITLPINLFYQLTNITFYLHFFRTYTSFSMSRTVRLIWGYIDWTFFAMQVLLFAWTTVERHILVFHNHLVSTKIKRFFLHYLPPIIIIVYCTIYYTLVIFAFGCENIDPDDHSSSIYPCAFQNERLYLYETIMNQIGPNFLIIISSLLFLIRIIRQKSRFNRQFRWRQHQKMIIHVLVVSLLYLIFGTPYSFVIFLYLAGMPTSIAGDFVKYSLFCLYYVLLLQSVVCAATLTGSLKQIQRFCRRKTTVHPMLRTLTSNKLDNTNALNRNDTSLRQT